MILLRNQRIAVSIITRGAASRTVSMSFTAPFTYINADQLATLLRSPDEREKVAIVDVRGGSFPKGRKAHGSTV